MKDFKIGDEFIIIVPNHFSKETKEMWHLLEGRITNVNETYYYYEKLKGIGNNASTFQKHSDVAKWVQLKCKACCDWEHCIHK